MKRKYKIVSTLLIALLFCSGVYANGITISNVTVLPNTNQLQFDISWENSWRSDILQNWDAAWVFMKSKGLNGQWGHLYLPASGISTAPDGYTIYIPPGGNGIADGAFLYRTAAGNGTASIIGVKLAIPAEYALGVYDIKVFGIEMVYIPTAPFWVGDFNTSSNSYTGPLEGSLPAKITAPSNGFFDVIDPIAGNHFGSPTSFPNGYSGFYCMKYEVSQAAYRDFLNTLTYTQQQSRTTFFPNSAVGTPALANTAGQKRSYIEIAVQGVANTTPAIYGCDANNNNAFDEPGDGEWLACNYLSWPDLAAYLNWACLAPMTELQYEKICRGPLQPLAAEYAWGTDQITSNTYSLVNAAQTGETISNGPGNTSEGNASYFRTNALINGPLRNGIFATATSNRISSGGSFYGVMEMAGNMWERVVTTANLQGRKFAGGNGNPVLTPEGNAEISNTSFWPGANGLYVIDGNTNALGMMYRGGALNASSTELRTSNRTTGNIISNTDNVRGIDLGGRGVRNL